MIYVSERYKNIYGQYQYRTIFKHEDFSEADKVFKAYTGVNEVTIDSSIDGETLAKREAV